VGGVGFGEEGSSGGMKAGFIETEGSKGEKRGKGNIQLVNKLDEMLLPLLILPVVA
jgi:hypothetical protein